ncbi:hypothetical protein [Mycobacteroides abscessus]|uniref:hypothetical protein n=1 Tax=Mycobacteroides abscessus TaxID=36809 RepID=UPI000928AE6A|nr:hypothetical protein [Mycobacteroides abscessus]MBN7296625.1 hypothetical protein [Mycobacteroides abscessus subsp. abscessus]SHR98082.1 Uncharacterised protein [Mycobacteroides abscessus subsp. abscessus]
MAHSSKPTASTSFGVAPITDQGLARAFVRMLSAAVESGDYAEAYRVVRGAEVHFGYVAAHPVAVTR